MTTPEIKKHPFHFIVTRIVGAILLVTFIVTFGWGLYLQQKHQRDLSLQLASVALISGILLPVWLIFRMKVLHCPSCGTWLFNKAKHTDKEPRKFSCEKCQVIWDTGYVMHFEMTDPD